MLRARRQTHLFPPRKAVALLCSALALATAGTFLGQASATVRDTDRMAAAARLPANCAGFSNRTGITNRTVTVANVSDLSGPTPGIHLDAQLAVKAYVASFNARTTLCGRKLKLLAIDSATDANADRAGYVRACGQAFAVVGSLSTYDGGGAARAQRCGLPDLRAQVSSGARYACTTCFATQVVEPGAVANAIPDFFVARGGAASAAMLYLNDGSNPQRVATLIQGEHQRGFTFVYTAAIDVAAFNYGPYVAQLKSKNVQVVQFVGPVQNATRLKLAMDQAGFHPPVFLAGTNVYTRSYANRGAAVDLTFVAVNFTPLEQAATNSELHAYKHWLQVVSPGTEPTADGLYAWSAAHLFAERALALGARLTRSHLVTALRAVHHWTDHGLHAAQDVGGRRNANCFRFLGLSGGQWRPIGGTAYQCHGKTLVG